MPGTECSKQLDRVRVMAHLVEGENLAPEALAVRIFGQGCVRDDFVSLPTEAELVRVGTSFRIFVRAKLAPLPRARAVARCIAEWCVRDEARNDDREETIAALAQTLTEGLSQAASSAA